MELLINLNKITNILNLLNTSIVPSFKKSYVTAKADSGATKHYFRPQDKICMDNITPQQAPTVFLPNMEEIHTTHS